MSSSGKNIKDLELKKFTTDDNGDVCVRVCIDNLPTSNDSNCETYIAGETLSAVKPVYISGSEEVSQADSDTKPEACVIGITKHSASLGSDIEVILSGELQDSSFNFNSNESIYLDGNGNLTTVPPTTGFLTKIGKGLGNNKILINIEEPIAL